MGVADELGYSPPDPNPVQRASQHLASTRAGSWLFSKFIHAVDTPIFRLSRGRVTLPTLLAGLPVVLLTTTGRKSGETRSMPLLAVPVADDLAVIGTNFGQGSTPGWVYNLEADPTASIAFRGTAVVVRARHATEAESDTIFGRAAEIYPGYAQYRQRAEHRRIRVFVLESAG